MPSLNRVTLVLQARKELIETGTTAGQWDDTELIEFLQEANEEITEIAEKEITATAVTVAGQETVDFPATVGTILRLWIRRSGSTDPWIKMREMDEDERLPDMTTGSTRLMPVKYMIFAGKIYVNPIPDQAYDLNVWGYQAASDFIGGNDSTVPVFDSRFHLLLKLYAIARGKQKMDDPGYQNYDGQYLAGIMEFRRAKLAQKRKQGPRVVRVVSGMWD